MNTEKNEQILGIVREHIHFIDGENAYIYEIGDGQMNYVYRVEDMHGKSVIVKHADKAMRSSGGSVLVSTQRSVIEYQQLMKMAEIVPDFVPEIYHYDKESHMLIMEDLKEYELLSEALSNFRIFPNFVAQISRYLFETLFRTTDIVIPSRQKKENVETLFNPEMAEITEREVFTEIFLDPDKAVFKEENREFLEEHIYNNEELKAEVSELKYKFKNCSQSMLHGDLHINSIFINQELLKVFDPEFAFYGPMGFDIGTLIGNLFVPWLLSYVISTEGKEDFRFWLEESIERILTRFFIEYDNNYEDLVTDPMAKNKLFKEKFRKDILADIIGYAGIEIIRSTIGSARALTLKQKRDDEKQIRLERLLILLGTHFIIQRNDIDNSKQFVAGVRKIVDLAIETMKL